MINRVILFFNNDCHRVSFKRIATEGRLLRSSYAEELKNYDKDSQQMDIFSVYKSIITEAVLNPAFKINYRTGLFLWQIFLIS